MPELRTYAVDDASLARAFPAAVEPPPGLAPFVAWLDGRPVGSLGGSWFGAYAAGDAPIVDGELLRDRFALFMLPDGSHLGCWYGTEASPADAPIGRSIRRCEPSRHD